jgi:hypothetical protein
MAGVPVVRRVLARARPVLARLLASRMLSMRIRRGRVVMTGTVPGMRVFMLVKSSGVVVVRHDSLLSIGASTRLLQHLQTPSVHPAPPSID